MNNKVMMSLGQFAILPTLKHPGVVSKKQRDCDAFSDAEKFCASFDGKQVFLQGARNRVVSGFKSFAKLSVEQSFERDEQAALTVNCQENSKVAFKTAQQNYISVFSNFGFTRVEQDIFIDTEALFKPVKITNHGKVSWTFHVDNVGYLGLSATSHLLSVASEVGELERFDVSIAEFSDIENCADEGCISHIAKN